MSVVVVSWVLVLLAVFGVNYSRDAIVESRSIATEIERHQLRAWARSAVELARVDLEHASFVECARLGHAGPENPLARSYSCGGGHFAVGAIDAIGDIELWTPGVRDEGAYLPMAIADSTTLSLLPGMSSRGIAALLRAKRRNGPHRLPPFEVLGLDPATLEGARRFLSRYGNAVNVNTASSEVLRAVGLPPRAVDKLLRWRNGTDRIARTSDDQRFPGLESNQVAIRACGLNSEEAAVLAYLVGTKRLTARASYFSLAARGWAEGFDGICEIRVVLHKSEQGRTSIVAWTENWLE